MISWNYSLEQMGVCRVDIVEGGQCDPHAGQLVIDLCTRSISHYLLLKSLSQDILIDLLGVLNSSSPALRQKKIACFMFLDGKTPAGDAVT